MSPFDKLIVRSWSAVVASGLDGTPAQVATQMRLAKDVDVCCDMTDVERRLAALRRMGQLG